MSDRVLLHAISRDATLPRVIRWPARLLSIYDRAPPRDLLDDVQLLFDLPLVWIGRRIVFALAGRARCGRLRERPGVPDWHSGWMGTAVWLVVWAAAIGAAVCVLG